jgi:hypothetical protein
MACKLDTDFIPTDCTDLEIGGVSGKLYLISYNDWLTATVTRDATTGEISAVVLTNTGAKAVEYDLPRGGIVATSPFTKNNGGKSGWTHSLQVFIPTKNQAVKKELATLANYGRVVGIVVLDSSVVANVYGNDIGLEISAYEEAVNDPSKGGGIDVTLSTPADTTLENLPPITFFDTDRATTLSALDLLKTPVV